MLDDDLDDPRIKGDPFPHQQAVGIIVFAILVFVVLYFITKKDKNQVVLVEPEPIQTSIITEVDETYSVNNSFWKGDEEKYGITK